LEKNRNLKRGTRYWNYASEDLVLGDKRNLKYKRKYTSGCVKKVKKRKEILQKGGLHSP
jgi:hypothetical protein